MSASVHRPSPPPRRAVALWLLLVCAAIAVMVVLGGITRLAHAGLSIVEWRPITGVLPPLSDAQWEEAFAAWQFPEYQKLNRGMDLSQFKSIPLGSFLPVKLTGPAPTDSRLSALPSPVRHPPAPTPARIPAGVSPNALFPSTS